MFGNNKKEPDLFVPDLDALKKALSSIMTQDPDTKKLFETGSRTWVKLFGGDINNFINMNTSLITASLLIRILEKLENIDAKLSVKE